MKLKDPALLKTPAGFTALAMADIYSSRHAKSGSGTTIDAAKRLPAATGKLRQPKTRYSEVLPALGKSDMVERD